MNSETRVRPGRLPLYSSTFTSLHVEFSVLSESWACRKDVLELPMPVNNTPEPVLKLLDDLSRVPYVIVAIATQAKGIGMQNFII
ncbi:MAG: hypothetical protein ACXV74_06340 [Methylobacter sp.]